MRWAMYVAAALFGTLAVLLFFASRTVIDSVAAIELLLCATVLFAGAAIMGAIRKSEMRSSAIREQELGWLRAIYQQLGGQMHD